MKWTRKTLNSKFALKKILAEKAHIHLKLINLESKFSGFAKVYPFGWNVAERIQSGFLAIGQFLCLLAPSAHMPVGVTFRTFVHSSFQCVGIGALRTLDECRATAIVYKWMVANVWTQWTSNAHVNLKWVAIVDELINHAITWVKFICIYQILGFHQFFQRSLLIAGSFAFIVVRWFNTLRLLFAVHSIIRTIPHDNL